MRNWLLFVGTFFLVSVVQAQEINALVTVHSEKVRGSNKQVFKTLETALTTFINETSWTQKTVAPQERISCAFTIVISEQPAANRFKASIQVQASRPVYNSSYSTPLLSMNDTAMDFKYNEFDPLYFDVTSFDSNLVATVAYYIYVILGLDADSFALQGGTSFYKTAEKIVLQAQGSGGVGWENSHGTQNRFLLIENLLSPPLKNFHTLWYNYHRKGMDVFSTETLRGKQAIENAVISLRTLHNKTAENYLIRVFLDAKEDELVQVFSGGPDTEKTQKMIQVLQRVAPTRSNSWEEIEY